MHGAWEDELICTMTMDEAGVKIPYTADSQADDSFQQDVRKRLKSIEAKLEQFLNHGCLPMATTTSSHHTPLDEPAEKTFGWAMEAKQQGTPACSIPRITLPFACPDTTKEDESEAVDSLVTAPRAARGQKPRSGSQNSSNSSSNSSGSSSNNSRKAKNTPHVPHVDLVSGASWMQEDSEEGSVHRGDTISRLSRRYGLRGAMKRVAQIQGKPSEQEVENMTTQPLWSLVHSSSFRAICSSMVILNVAFVGALTEVELWNATGGQPKSMWWSVGNIIFCLYFLVEIALRLAAEKTLFFNGPHFRWNIFDMLVVILSVMDVGLDLSGDEPPTQNIVIARILRLSRLLRIMSVARVMRACHSLRLVVLTIFESISSLAWCFLVLAIIIFTFAIFVVQGVTAELRLQNAIADGGSVQQQELRAALLELFGGVPAAANCLFMMVSGGIDWKDAMVPMKQVDGFYEYFFTFYVFFMVVGVLNVVVGAFVAATGEIANRDRDLIVKAEMTQLTSYLDKVRTFFTEADVDKSGKLSWEEFKSYLDDKRVKTYFHALGMDVSQAESLFRLLDKNGNEKLNHEEFMAGCMRLRGQAKSLDVNLLLHEQRQLSRKVSLLKDSLQQRDFQNDSQRDACIHG